MRKYANDGDILKELYAAFTSSCDGTNREMIVGGALDYIDEEGFEDRPGLALVIWEPLDRTLAWCALLAHGLDAPAARAALERGWLPWEPGRIDQATVRATAERAEDRREQAAFEAAHPELVAEFES